MCKKIDNSVIEGDDDAAGPLGPARDWIESPRGRRTSARVRGSSEAWFKGSTEYHVFPRRDQYKQLLLTPHHSCTQCAFTGHANLDIICQSRGGSL